MHSRRNNVWVVPDVNSQGRGAFCSAYILHQQFAWWSGIVQPYQPLKSDVFRVLLLLMPVGLAVGCGASHEHTQATEQTGASAQTSCGWISPEIARRISQEIQGSCGRRPNLPEVLITGWLAVDTIQMPNNRIYRDELGGAPLYAAYGARYLSQPVVASVVGRDYDSKFRRALLEVGMTTRALTTANGETSKWVGVYRESDHTRDGVFSLGSTSTFNLDKVGKKMPSFAYVGPQYPADQVKLVHEFRRPDNQPSWVTLDTIVHFASNKGADLIDAMNASDLVTLNEEEALALIGAEHQGMVQDDAEIESTGQAIMNRITAPRLIIKRGENGSTLFVHNDFEPLEIRHVKARPAENVKTLDPTGAGDAFGAAVTAYLAYTNKRDTDTVYTAMHYASMIASITVSDIGTHAIRMLSRDTIFKQAKACANGTATKTN